MVLDKVALTGTSGMLGRHVLAALAQAGINVAGASRTRPDILGADDQWASWDLREWKTPDELDALFGEAQAVIHLGAVVPAPGEAATRRDTFDANVRACLALGEWAMARNLPLVFISSATVYAAPEAAGISENAPQTRHGFGGFYGFSKVLAENVFENLRGEGLAVAILRPSSTYGAGLPSKKMLSGFLETAEQDQTIELVPPINDRVDMLHAADLAQAILATLRKGAWGTFNISSGHPASIEEIARTCIDVVGKGAVAVAPGANTERPAITRFDLNPQAARDQLAFAASIDLHRGIEMTWKNDLLA